MFPDLTHRRRHRELMDAPDVDERHLASSLRFLQGVNRYFGYTRSTLKYLHRFSRRWKRGETIHLLDIGTGLADVPRAILRWADAAGWDVRITAVDLHEKTIAAARAAGADPRLTILRADALHLPFADASFDYCLTSTFLHHLDTADAAKVLAAMNRLSRRGVIIADLRRTRWGYVAISLLGKFTNPVVAHDGPVSVAQAFTQAEVLALRDQAGLTYTRYANHFGNRFVLWGERSLAER